MCYSVPSCSWHDNSGKMKVYCIKTMYNRDPDSTEYVLFKKGNFYDTNKTGYFATMAINTNGYHYQIDPDYFVYEQEWRENRLKDLGL
jgi:hypothetical protein